MQFAVEIIDMQTGRVCYASRGAGHAIGFTDRYSRAALFDEATAEEEVQHYRELFDNPKIWVHAVVGGSYDSREDMRFNAMAQVRSRL